MWFVTMILGMALGFCIGAVAVASFYKCKLCYHGEPKGEPIRHAPDYCEFGQAGALRKQREGDGV